ncbi:MAG: hypothetical protein CME85_01375 [Henriciella sp.]|jgi:hypothetical protein|nr:hypothetical protein [Henriciella sp.]MBK74126.1 hypothetical protein [Henriciella sp.]|tara:strand:+ start:68298 stop:68852 length:555 start_codon:yes stop_codon:yes gene_type:complete
MVSKQAIVETEITQNQSEVRQKSEAFETLAQNEGWVSETGGMAGLAHMLFGSDGKQQASSAQTYAEKVAASSGDPAEVYSAVADDATRAAATLGELDRLADTLLDNGNVARIDLISFESALVTAQKSYRNFAEATGLVETRGKDGLPAAEDALRKFARTIDGARASADLMAGAYADNGEADPLS